MACATATFPEVISFDVRGLSRGDPGRAIFRRVGRTFATVIAAGVTAAFIATAAAWIVATALSIDPNLHTRAPFGWDTAALTNPYRTPADMADFDGRGRAPIQLAQAADATFQAETQRPAVSFLSRAPAGLDMATLTNPNRTLADMTDLGGSPPEVQRTAALGYASTGAAPLRPKPIPESVQSVLSPPRPSDGPHGQAKPDIVRLPAPQVAMLAPPPAPQKPAAARQAHTDSNAPPDLDNHTAVYDIAAHTVYLPNGERLEAHSGLGEKLDNPRYVNVKDRGPTPPNVYGLTLREEIFHGVRAIRLNPVDESKNFGRDGMLAHTYMLGPTGQSFGCVSFKDYPAFLHAFLKGDVDRLVVVPHREVLAGRGQMAALQNSK